MLPHPRRLARRSSAIRIATAALLLVSALDAFGAPPIELEDRAQVTVVVGHGATALPSATLKGVLTRYDETGLGFKSGGKDYFLPWDVVRSVNGVTIVQGLRADPLVEPPVELAKGSKVIVVVGSGTRLAPGTELRGQLTQYDGEGIHFAAGRGQRYALRWEHVRSVNGIRIVGYSAEEPRATSVASAAPALVSPGAPPPPAEPASARPQASALTIGKVEGFKLRIYGFLLGSIITDSTRSFTEAASNSLVQTRSALTTTATPPPAAAENPDGRLRSTLTSVRGSRLGFDMALPETASGVKTQGLLELDLNGSSAVDTKPGQTSKTQTEENYFNKAAFGLRHAYVSVTYGRWNAIIGHTNSLLGWTQYYMPSQQTEQGPGTLTRRFFQARLTRALSLGDSALLEAAADFAKPAEMNSALPSGHAGLRLSSTRSFSGIQGREATGVGATSLSVTGGLYPVRTGDGNALGAAAAVDLRLALIAASDPKDMSNTLSVNGEATQGSGYAVEFVGLSFGVPAITAANGTPAASTALDPGLAGLNADKHVELIRLRTFRGQMTYVFPAQKWTAVAGYVQIEGRNLDRFSNSQGTNSFGWGFAPKIQSGYFCLAYDPVPWFRAGAEFEQIRDTYNDPNNRFALNNRVAVNTYFKF